MKKLGKKCPLQKKGIFGAEHNKWVSPDNRKGKLNTNIRRLPKMKKWRKQVFERDNYACQLCKARGVEINADHIVALCILIVRYNITMLSEAINEPVIWDLDNGRTLCINCH